MKKQILFTSVVVAFIAFAWFSYAADIPAGRRALTGLVDFATQMAILLPAAFVLIGLFEVWIKKETVERYFGEKTGFRSYLVAIVLAGITIGGLYVAFPLAYTLYKKGAKLAVIFTYITASGICRIPMTIFEASFLGIKFTLIRFAVSLPLVILTSWGLGYVLQKRGYALKSPGNESLQ
ncbi:MAG: permease [candidate division KSB1 bacterium]|nr:permease [candidate division KSB1 bacterium]